MSIFNLSDMTWEEVRDLPKARAVAVLPAGAVEAHGPHLPLTTDVIISEEMARAGAGRLSERGYDVLILPSLAYTAAGFAAGFPGTISLNPSTVTAVILDIARSLSTHGLRFLAVANSHLDPGHIASIQAAVAASRQETELPIIFPDLTSKPWALRLTAEFKSGACHAGQYESSVVLAARPDLVRDEIRQSLPANATSLSEAIAAGKKTFEEANGPRAYFGSPAQATRHEGARTIEILGSILEEAVLAAFESGDASSG